MTTSPDQPANRPAGEANADDPAIDSLVNGAPDVPNTNADVPNASAEATNAGTDALHSGASATNSDADARNAGTDATTAAGGADESTSGVRADDPMAPTRLDGSTAGSDEATASADDAKEEGTVPTSEPDTTEPTSAPPAFAQADVDALVNGMQTDEGADAKDRPVNEAGDDLTGNPEVSQADIDALLEASSETTTDDDQLSQPPTPHDSGATEPDTRIDAQGRPFDEAAAAMQAAMENEANQRPATSPASNDFAVPSAGPGASGPLPTESFALPELRIPEGVDIDPKRVSMLNDVNLRVRIELGRTRMLVEDVLKLDEGSVVELDKLAGDPVDVMVDDRLIARGEVLVLNDNFCVRISEVLAHDPHRVSV